MVGVNGRRLVKLSPEGQVVSDLSLLFSQVGTGDFYFLTLYNIIFNTYSWQNNAKATGKSI